MSDISKLETVFKNSNVQPEDLVYKIYLNLNDLKLVKILSEQWAFPLKGFMNENEYFQSLFFKYLKINGKIYNQPIPIVLSFSEQNENNLINRIKKISLMFDQKNIGFMDKVSFFQTHDEFNQLESEWLIGGDLLVSEKIKFNDGLDEYRYSLGELKNQFKILNADVVFAFCCSNPIDSSCGLFIRQFKIDLIQKGYKNPIFLLFNLDNDRRGKSFPASIILEQQSAIFESIDLKFIATLIPSPVEVDKKITELQWVLKVLINIGVSYFILSDEKNSNDALKLVKMAPGLEDIQITPYFVNKSIQIDSLENFLNENRKNSSEIMNQKAWEILENYSKNLFIDSDMSKTSNINEKKFVLVANARSGSTYLASLLRCHYQVGMKSELLNESIKIEPENIFSYLNKSLVSCNKPIVGFKVLNDQIPLRNIKSDDLLRSINAKFAIILWRQHVLDTFVSLKIAEISNNWYKSKYAKHIHHEIELEESQIWSYYGAQMEAWRLVAKYWPIEVEPYFLTYEDFVKNPILETKKALAYMMLDPEDQDYESDSDKMNPKTLPEKVINWNQLSDKVKSLRMNVREIFEQELFKTLKLNNNKINFLPEREPRSPKGIIYRVSEPFISEKSVKYINQSLSEKSISSASPWPRILASKLKDLYQVATAFPCSNGFTALVLALQLAGIKPNDQVVCPSFTMIAVANSIHYLNATPIFVDNADLSYNPDWNTIEKKINPNTKAVIICHTLGVPIEYNKLKTITSECKKRNIFLIEDISECVGVKIKIDDEKAMFLGSFGDLACASLYANKIINCGDGGFVLSKCYSDQTKLESFVNHGFTNSYHFVHFKPSINGKINGMAAAFALGSFESLDFIIEKRKHLTNLYRTELSRIKCIKTIPKCGDVDTAWVFGIECPDKHTRNALRKHLMNFGIETRDYFFPLHLQPAFSAFYDQNSAFPNCERLGSVGFYLPTYTDLKDSEAKYIISKVYDFFRIPYSVSFDSISKTNDSFLAVEFNAKSLDLNVRKMDPWGNLNALPKFNIFNKAISIKQKMDDFFNKNNLVEPWYLLDELNVLLKNAKNYPQINEYFEPCVKYLKDEICIECSSESPWLNQVYDSTNLELIPTTTDSEILKLLYWLVKDNLPRNVLELGCWLGHATLLMANAHNDTKIYAVDNFCWQYWMNHYVDDNEISLNIRQSFEKIFIKNTKKRQEQIITVRWPISINDSDELEKYWLKLRRLFIPEKTLIVLNGVDQSLIRFINSYRHELQVLFRPKIYSERKLNFLNFNEFDHLHNNVFKKCIDLLKENYHDDNADVYFIPAVEVTVCDNPQVLNKHKWIGIIHSCIQNCDHFYVPDLEKLCSEKFDHLMKNCIGLFTLTTQQADYLKQCLKYKIPIQRLIYPFILDEKTKINHTVPNEVINLTLVGNFARDFDFFLKVKTNSLKIKKISLAPAQKSRKKIEHFNNTNKNKIEIIEHLNGEQYEKLLEKSVIFLALKHQGAANTIILEFVPNISSCTEYIGNDYPLLYEPNKFDLSQVITSENIKNSIFYLKNIDKSKLSTQSFLYNFSNGIVLKSLPPHNPQLFEQFDISVCVCSFKRTHNLELILENLWSQQNFELKYEIIVWNNNYSRMNLLKNIKTYPNDVICSRGHIFLPHKINLLNPEEVWQDYENLRFIADEKESQSIHFVHADTCLIPREALNECCSVSMSDQGFNLVDDYWMSYVLNGIFRRNLRKLKVTAANDIFERTEDSDTVGLALHTLITLDGRLATAEIWASICKKIGKYKNVIGYDLINEPFTQKDTDLCTHNLPLNKNIDEVEAVVQRYKNIAIELRKYDLETPIVLEPTFWSSLEMLDLLVECLEKDDYFLNDNNIMLSIHFYEPKNLTFYSNNYVFPGYIPKYFKKPNETEYWNEEKMREIIQSQIGERTQKGFKVLVGEFGIRRNVEGAENYLRCGLDAFNQLNVPVFIFSFRDPFCHKMNYEFGPDDNNRTRLLENENNLFCSLREMIKKINY
ncbi:aminotransferase [Brachionus plicatilis]|uniref:Aminotransferase n=1 Tax=Brachionus plicatilis TaxID=10195 RepID=A0A3M7PVB4_BRAPC|nr:aminotransferase [Brachionus plicatilis]